jgi:hypothetical protein
MYVCIGCKKEETEEIVKKMGLAGNGEDTFACKECSGDDFSDLNKFEYIWDVKSQKHVLICRECESIDTEDKGAICVCNNCAFVEVREGHDENQQ